MKKILIRRYASTKSTGIAAAVNPTSTRPATLRRLLHIPLKARTANTTAAAAVVVASEEWAEKEGKTPLARILSYGTVAGPIPSSRRPQRFMSGHSADIMRASQAGTPWLFTRSIGPFSSSVSAYISRRPSGPRPRSSSRPYSRSYSRTDSRSTPTGYTGSAETGTARSPENRPSLAAHRGRWAS